MFWCDTVVAEWEVCNSHKNPLKYGNDMGGLWEGGPTIEGPGKSPNNSLSFSCQRTPHRHLGVRFSLFP